MSLSRLLLLSLRYHWRVNVAVALAAAAATAVLTGALVVGDCMRGSLTHLTLDRLGRIDEVLIADRFFRAELAEEWSHAVGSSLWMTAAVPAILVEGSVAMPAGERAARAGDVTILATGPQFWTLGQGGPPQSPGRGEVVLNAPLAEDLGAKVGDEVIVRVGRESDIPAEKRAGRKNELVRSRRLKVSAIVPASGLGRFGLRPNQQLPLNAYLNLGTLQDALEQPDHVNAVLIAGTSETAPPEEFETLLAGKLRPTLDDYGLELKLTGRGYWQLTSQRMLIEPVTEKAAALLLTNLAPHPTFTYLANTIRAGDVSVPYSTICAIDFSGSRRRKVHFVRSTVNRSRRSATMKLLLINGRPINCTLTWATRSRSATSIRKARTARSASRPRNFIWRRSCRWKERLSILI